jgi:putative tryptophan/tyrosine transport system substrate-binding protein
VTLAAFVFLLKQFEPSDDSPSGQASRAAVRKYQSEMCTVPMTKNKILVKKVFIFCFLAMMFMTTDGFPQPKVSENTPRVGFLGVNDEVASKDFIEAFRQGLRDIGYIEGKNIVVYYRWAEGNAGRLTHLAAELVNLKVDVIFAAAAQAITAAMDASGTIPIVFEMLADPVSAGFVNSLAKPGANVTGIAGLAPELSGKRLELLKEIVPRLTSVAIVANPNNPNFRSVLKESEQAAAGLKLRLQAVQVRQPAELDGSFGKMIKDGSEAVSVVPDSMLFAQRKTIIDLAVQKKLPVVYGMSGVADAGGLMTYSPNQREMWHRAATYVNKILKGAKPAELPVEQPTKFEFVINLKAAKQIGVTIPPNVLARADKVIR